MDCICGWFVGVKPVSVQCILCRRLEHLCYYVDFVCMGTWELLIFCVLSVQKHDLKKLRVRDTDLSPCHLLGPDSKQVIKLAGSQLLNLYYREDNIYDPRTVHRLELYLVGYCEDEG